MDFSDVDICLDFYKVTSCIIRFKIMFNFIKYIGSE